MISSTRASRSLRFEIAPCLTQVRHLRSTIVVFAIILSVCAIGQRLFAQTPAKPTNKIGTVETIAAHTVTLKSDDGKTSTITVPDDTRILQIAPGSTSLKSAVVISLTDIAVGDRILVTGQPGSTPQTLDASRVILMKLIDISRKRSAEAEEWEKHGTGGLVSAIDPATGTLTLTARGKKIAILTNTSTIFRRYAGDSVKYEDAKPSILTQMRPGDQMRVRGQRSEDGTTIVAAEIVSGTFLNISGTIATLDAATRTLTIKDLATKKNYSIVITPNSNLRALPPEEAQKFAARARNASAASGHPATPGEHSKPASAPAEHPTSAGTVAGAPASAPAMTLSQLLPTLPAAAVSDLHPGEALMIVASQPTPGSTSLTAITVLTGVEPILTAAPSGQSGPSLSPWNVSGTPDGGM